MSKRVKQQPWQKVQAVCSTHIWKMLYPSKDTWCGQKRQEEDGRIRWIDANCHLCFRSLLNAGRAFLSPEMRSKARDRLKELTNGKA